ncbi:MAG: hypothetical protein ACHQ50_11390 [Fimbriimonadales bacterium]
MEARSREAGQASASICSTDVAIATETWQINVHPSGGLVGNIRRLASMAGSAPDPQDVICLCISATQTGAEPPVSTGPNPECRR